MYIELETILIFFKVIPLPERYTCFIFLSQDAWGYTVLRYEKPVRLITEDNDNVEN